MLYNLIILYVDVMVSIYGDKFEHELDKFLESEHYDAAEDAIYDLVRAAFEAGWIAAKADVEKQ